MANISLGSSVCDRITGFKGIAAFSIEYMHGCIRYGVRPALDNDGQLPEDKILDGPDLEVIAPPRGDLPPAIKTPNTFKLGVKVRDRLTGFMGITVLRIKHMYAGDRYGVQPSINKKGEIPEIKSFDEVDLEQIDPPAPKQKKKDKPPAGPHDRRVVMAR